jgi:hypothetical protein
MRSMWNPSKVLRNSRGWGTTMEVLGDEICKVLDDYIAVIWIPNREKLQRHHRIGVRSMEVNTTAAAEYEHSSNKKFEDSVKPNHGIAKTALTLDKNSRKRNGEIYRKRPRQQNPMLFGKLSRKWMLSPCLLRVLT